MAWEKLIPFTSIDGKPLEPLWKKVLESKLQKLVIPNKLPIFLVFIFIRSKKLSGIKGDCDGTFWICPLKQPTLFFLLGQPLILFSDLLWSLCPLNNLPAFCFQAFGSQVVVNGSLMGITQHFICFLRFIEQYFCFLFPEWVSVLVRVVDPAESAVGIGDFILRSLH